MKIYQKSILLIICSFIFILSSCTTFKYPTGVWTCEELGITLDFDDNDGMGGPIDARGEIITDKGNKPIVCMIDATSGIDINYPDELEKHPSERKDLFYGSLKNIGKNKMIFTSFQDENRHKYEFIKQG